MGLLIDFAEKLFGVLLNTKDRAIFREALNYFSERERAKVYAYGFLSCTLAFLDLFGVTLLGLLGSLSVSTLTSNKPGAFVSEILMFIGIENSSIQVQVAILALGACTILILKTF